MPIPSDGPARLPPVALRDLTFIRKRLNTGNTPHGRVLTPDERRRLHEMLDRLELEALRPLVAESTDRSMHGCFAALVQHGWTELGALRKAFNLWQSQNESQESQTHGEGK